MRLKCNDHRAVVVFACSRNRFTHGRRMMRIVVDNGHVRRFRQNLEAAAHAAKFCERCSNFRERNIGEPLLAGDTPVHYVKYVHDLRALLQKQVPPGALVLMLGAGNITKVAADLARDLRSAEAPVK